ncbi:hypothetical protein BU23DRAFT_604288 [Bimuria novae-zelandiae CBS 107.79]|uniref:Uncharacterized protein n=1 Tax=Bimuria novae-zelandiae CBS 107.79 TaxID=1447943 RepID=A0A6A5UJ95_9PLEO|nr:hypothetical protein BU23DRAFT_604288 [Bimuria novae-zelandiae CBS 107.79]
MWQSFRNDVVGSSSHTQAQRYTRLNPQVRFRTPKMDDKSQIDRLYDDVGGVLQKLNMHDKIVRIAYRLVASCFYFEKSGSPREVDDHFIIQGTIGCRFGKGSDNLRALGGYMQRHQLYSFQPYFKVQEVKQGDKAQTIKLTQEIISTMINTGYFSVGSIVIPVSKEVAFVSINLHLSDDKKKPHPFSGFPISGFPRSLADGETIKKTTSSSTSSESDRTSMAQKRESLRRKRTVRARFTDNPDRPVSTASTSGSSGTNSNTLFEFPESADGVSDWIRRRGEARRPPPKPVLNMDVGSQGVFELDGSPLSEVVVDEDEVGLAEAMARSQRAGMAALNRTGTGTDEDELQRVLMMSLIEK